VYSLFSSDVIKSLLVRFICQLPQERGVKRIQKDVISQNKDEVSSLKKCKFEAGRLKNFIHVWKELTSDEQILDIVENCHIELETSASSKSASTSIESPSTS
jgi:hypothetical protein